MNTRTEATIEDLYRVLENGKAELVNGEIVLMSPTGGLPNYAAGEIFVSLREYARGTAAGHAVTDNAGFIVNLPHRKSFSPDAAFYTGPLSMKFIEGAPLLAVEIRSEGDYGPAAEESMANGRADYFDAGTEIVWDVDLLGEEVARVYRAANRRQATIYRRGEIAEAEPALPGWSMPVDYLLPRTT